ncbi:aromatic amino acid exporter YddG [Saccharospirillum salsuginis]|uniref:Membrane protein n=1 Tax=Saccharospirillum salsuginis TaxID=418750 RepID=A0A918N8U4_9GAMM|nr:DMT family transporter [Saccharospirillum salsuginis]GGX48450.1 membrane protein [Saccharospirillum salsuginis]
MTHRTSHTATLWGVSTLLNWATLALLTQLAGPVPPFLLTGLCLGGASVLALVVYTLSGQGEALVANLKQPLRVWVLGVGGLFGYHFLYFVAQQNAPSAEAGLISYLWPLLIVLLTGLLPGERLRWHHGVGGFAGFVGAALLIGPNGLSLSGEYGLGYMAALTAAFVWSGYSVLSRLFARVPTTMVAWTCLASAGLSILCHGLWEPRGWPPEASLWAVLALGLGPVGSAFFTWDYAVKRGDLRLLGLLAYFTPVLSTLLLITAGIAPATPTLALATGLIVVGALVGSGHIGIRRPARSAASAPPRRTTGDSGR